MSIVSNQNPDAKLNTQQSSSLYASDKTNGKLFNYKGSHKMVFVDQMNGGKEYIFDENGKKLYLEDYAILQMKNDQTSIKDRLISGLDEQEASREKQKTKWFEKFNIQNKNYNLFTAAKKAANKSYQAILSQTGCSSLSELKEYAQVNGGDYLTRAKAFLTERAEARSGQIKAEAMSAFYGRMYVDECRNVSDIQCQKLFAQSIFDC